MVFIRSYGFALAILLLPVLSYGDDYSIGVGIGRLFGAVGVNGSYFINDDINVAVGIGTGRLDFVNEPNYSLGVNYMFGAKGDARRKRIGLNYNEYQESGLQVKRYDFEGNLLSETSDKSRFKGVELDLGMIFYVGSTLRQSWEFGTTIPLIKQQSADDELWGDDTYTEDENGIHIHLEFYIGYRRYFF